MRSTNLLLLLLLLLLTYAHTVWPRPTVIGMNTYGPLGVCFNRVMHDSLSQREWGSSTPIFWDLYTYASTRYYTQQPNVDRIWSNLRTGKLAAQPPPATVPIFFDNCWRATCLRQLTLFCLQILNYQPTCVFRHCRRQLLHDTLRHMLAARLSFFKAALFIYLFISLIHQQSYQTVAAARPNYRKIR